MGRRVCRRHRAHLVRRAPPPPNGVARHDPRAMTERSFPTISRHPGGFALRVALLALATAASSWAQGHDDTTSATSGTSLSELAGPKPHLPPPQNLYRAA